MYVLILLLGTIFLFILFILLLAYVLNFPTLKQKLKEIPFLCFIFAILLMTSYTFINNFDIFPQTQDIQSSSSTQPTGNDDIKTMKEDIKDIKKILRSNTIP